MRATPAELTQLMDKMRQELYTTGGSFARGKLVFDTQCAKCHKFDGRGHEVGPNIEGAGRDIEYLLINMLDPNRVIGAPYFMRTINLLNGRVETGLLHAEDDTSVTLKTENGILKQIQKKDIDDLKVQEKSLMPEGLTKDMSHQDFRDLVRYVMANPFVTDVVLTAIPAEKGTTTSVKVNAVVGVAGRIPIPQGDWKELTATTTVTAPEDMTVRLLVGSKADYAVNVGTTTVKGKGSGVDAQPDQSSVEVRLVKGENRLHVTTKASGKGQALYLRFHDPDRKLRYRDIGESQPKK